MAGPSAMMEAVAAVLAPFLSARLAPLARLVPLGPADTAAADGSGDRRPSVLSVGSVGSVLSIGSVGSVLSIGSVGSALSVGSVGSFASVLSVESFASVLSVGSFASVLSVGCFGSAQAVGSVLAVPAVRSAGRSGGRWALNQLAEGVARLR